MGWAKAGEAMMESMVRVLKVRSMPVTSTSLSPAPLSRTPSREVCGVHASAMAGKLVAEPASTSRVRAQLPRLISSKLR